MKKNIIAALMMAAVYTSPACAQLSSSEQNNIDAYINQNPSIPMDKIQAIRGMDNMQTIKYFLSGNTYWDQSSHTLINMLDQFNEQIEKQQQQQQQQSMLDAQRVVEQQNSVKQQQIADAATRQREADQQQAMLDAQHAVEQQNSAKQQQIADAAARQREIDLQQAMIDAPHKEPIDDTVDNTLIATQARDTRQTKDIENNAAAITDNKDHIEQVEHDADTRTRRQNKINMAIGNTLLKTEKLDTEQTKHIKDNTAEIDDNKEHIELVEHNADIRTRRQDQINRAMNNTFAKTEALDAKQSADIKSLGTDVQQNASIGAYAKSRADAAYANSETNRQALQATNHRLADNTAELANHEQRIDKLESSSSANFGKLKNEVDDNRQRASAAISGVAAMANIPQVIQGQTFSVGAGVGTTDGESALAVGFSARAAEHVVVKASVSDDTQQNFVVGGGVSYGW